MIKRLFRRSAAKRSESTLVATGPPLSDAHRRQTDAILDSLVRHGVLFTDEFQLESVIDHVRCNGPDNPDDPLEFEEVIGAVAHTLDPLTNLVFIPSWSEVNSGDVEEFVESLCWLAGINTSAMALPSSGAPNQPADSDALEVRFDIEPGMSSGIAVQLLPKGVPVNLIEGIAELVDPLIAPKQLVATMAGADCIISALDPSTMATVNAETNARYEPVRSAPTEG